MPRGAMVNLGHRESDKACRLLFVRVDVTRVDYMSGFNFRRFGLHC